MLSVRNDNSVSKSLPLEIREQWSPKKELQNSFSFESQQYIYYNEIVED